VREPHGRIIVRGQSPSTGRFRPICWNSRWSRAVRDAMDHGEHESAGWPMVPTPAGVTMLPSEMALRPDVTPFLPAMDAPSRSRRERGASSRGRDFIDLDAELVRRTINGQTYTMYSYNGQYPGPLIEVSA